MKKIIFCIVVFSVVSCNFFKNKEEIKVITKNKSTDIFYKENEGLDYIRFPLLKPFDATFYEAEKIWFLGIGRDTFIYSDNMYELAIIKSNIFVHSVGKTFVGDNFVEEGWYIYDTTDKTFLKEFKVKKNSIGNYGIEKYFLKGFTTKKDFLDYLKSIKIDSEKLIWQKPADIYKQFKETGCLPWIPTCE